MPRVLVTEDSIVARTLLVSILDADPALTVVGQAKNGREAVEMTARLDPDVITMDVHMPVMDGLEATRQIMERTPKPIVIVSADDPKDVRGSFRALQAGALSVLGKPPGPSNPDFKARANELCMTVKTMSEMRVITRRPRKDPAADPTTVASPASAPPRPVPPAAVLPATPKAAAETPAGGSPWFPGVDVPAPEQRRVDLVAIGSSTGGPAALATVLGGLSATVPTPILIVQHITRGFDQGLVDWLDGITPLTVRLAGDGQPVRAGEVLIAPCDRHMGVSAVNRSTVLSDGPVVDGHRPSATHLFRSVAAAYGRHTLGVILTGMGEDGASGLVTVQQAGGWVIGQDEASSVVYGMPGAAVARGVVNQVVPLTQVAPTIQAALQRGRTTRAA